MLRTKLFATAVASLCACGTDTEPTAIGFEHPLDINAIPASQSSRVGNNGAPPLCETPFEMDDRSALGRAERLLNVNDHEIDPLAGRVAFQNVNAGTGSGAVLVATLQPEDGMADLRSLQLVDTNTTSRCASVPFGNGPEWAFGSRRGTELYYGKLNARGIPVVTRATQGFEPEAPWITEVLEDSRFRSCTFPSFNLRDAYPTLTYIVTNPGQPPYGAWRIDAPEWREAPVPGLAFEDITGGSPARMVPGRRESVAALEDSKGQVQLTRLELETGHREIISDYNSCSRAADCKLIRISSVGVVRAPKFGRDAYVFYAIINNAYIDAYLTVGDGVYHQQSPIRPPVAAESPNHFVLDEENLVSPDGDPFIVISMNSGTINGQGTAEIWLASPFATSACHYRQVVSANGPETRRADLDSLTFPGTTSYVYHRVLDERTGRWSLRRAATGL